MNAVVSDDLVRQLNAVLGDRVDRDVPLAPMTTYRVGGSAALFVDAHTVDDLVAVAEARAATAIPILVIGRGSNMLVSDRGFAGIVVSIANLGDQIMIGEPAAQCQSGDPCVVTAGGGVALPVLARRTASEGVRGFEWAVGVPGSVGGAVRMNAGGHGSDMARCLIDAEVFSFDQPSADTVTVPVDGLGLRFRASALAPADVVIGVRLALRRGDAAAGLAEIAQIVKWRREHQPGGQNCGSVFVNPVPGEVTAGGLIDGLGLRGWGIGTAHVSRKHANFIQASDGGSADDVRAVIEAVRERVAKATGFVLRSEVRLVGFDDTDPLSFAEAGVA